MTRSSFSMRSLALGVAAMAAVVLASNILVQYPFAVTVGSLNLADLLTWGAFTYPAAFLVTDLTNRRFGPAAARRVVYVGFVVAVLLSIALATPRIALASGSAFLVAQLLDILVFDRLRGRAWWTAPFVSSLVGSSIDTILFFAIAFSGAFGFLGYGDDFALGAAPLLGVMATDAPRWVSWALGDFGVKMLVAVALLVPYRVVIALMRPVPEPA